MPDMLPNDCECLIECDGQGSLDVGEVCRANRLRELRLKIEEKTCRLCGRKGFGEGSICQTCANLNSL